MTPTVYLISGANRGIGLGLATKLTARPNTIVFAGARNPDTATELKKLAVSNPAQVHVVKLASGDSADSVAAVETIRKVAGRLDVVIANAGICNSFKGVAETSTAQFREHWDVNVGGPHDLFVQTLPLLRSSPRTSDNPMKFVVISATGGSFELAGALATTGIAAYRASKVAVNFLVREAHFEHEADGLVAFPICPGSVDTDLFNQARANIASAEESMESMNYSVNTVDQSVTGVLKVIDTATRETHGGKFINFAGEPLPF